MDPLGHPPIGIAPVAVTSLSAIAVVAGPAAPLLALVLATAEANNMAGSRW
jgi:hypothetical protein